jgi:hypothetical protein
MKMYGGVVVSLVTTVTELIGLPTIHSLIKICQIVWASVVRTDRWVIEKNTTKPEVGDKHNRFLILKKHKWTEWSWIG